MNADPNSCPHHSTVLLSGFIQLTALASMGAFANKSISAKRRLLQVLTGSFLHLPASPPPRKASDPWELGPTHREPGPSYLQPSLHSQDTALGDQNIITQSL